MNLRSNAEKGTATVMHPPRRQALMYALLTSVLIGANESNALDLIGYVPYYRIDSNYLDNMLPQQLALLDEVRYFGLSVNGTGGITSLEGSVASQKSNIAAIKSIIDDLPAAQRPRLNITLGGAGVDAAFTGVAASAANRTTLANNIAALLTETGATSVDLDWEHPDAGIERTTYYPALLKKVKEKVGPARRVYATVDPTVMIPSSVLSGADGIDGISLMTYDIGWFAGDPNPNGEQSLHQYVVDSIGAWTDPASANSQRPYAWTNASWGNDTAADKLGVGLPFYGTDIANNLLDYTYAELLAQWTPTGNGYYTKSGQTVWIPDQQDVEDRVQLAYDEGLQHIIIWELGQDVAPTSANSMLKIAADKLASLTNVPGDFNGDTFVDGDDLLDWQANFGASDESDADGDSDSDGHDFLIWQRSFSLSAPVATSATAVPEPGTLLLGACLLALWVVRTPSRSRRHTI